MPELPSFDEILAELNRLEGQNVDGFTIAEYSKKVGRHIDWCRKRIKELITSGNVEYAGRKNDTTIDGRRCKVPLYRVIKNDHNQIPQ